MGRGMATESDMDREERGLLEAAQAGDEQARERLIAEHLPGLRAFVRLKMRPGLRALESCSDVVQSVCRAAIQGLEGFEYRGTASFRGLLFRSALNKLVDHERYWLAAQRDAGREVPLAAGNNADRSLIELYASIATPSRIAMDAEEVDRIEQAFDRLPERQREVILLSRLVGLSHGEIARRLDCSEEASRNLLRRGLVRLASLLDEEPG